MDKKALDGLLASLETACAANPGHKTLNATLSLADICLWSGLFPAMGVKGMLPAEEQAKYPKVVEWFSAMNNQVRG